MKLADKLFAVAIVVLLCTMHIFSAIDVYNLQENQEQLQLQIDEIDNFLSGCESLSVCFDSKINMKYIQA